jgi:hypothetical protein
MSIVRCYIQQGQIRVELEIGMDDVSAFRW